MNNVLYSNAKQGNVKDWPKVETPPKNEYEQKIHAYYDEDIFSKYSEKEVFLSWLLG